MFKKKFIAKWHKIANAKNINAQFQKEYEIYGPIHKLFLNPKNTLVKNITKL